jgi:hypothetical protein
MAITALWACGAQAFPGGFLGTCDQTAEGDKLLYCGQTVNIMDFAEPHEAEELADAGHGLQPIQSVGVMVFTGFEDGEFDIAKQRIVLVDERESDCETLVHSRLSKALGDSITVGLIGNLFADRRQLILAVGVLDVCQELGPLACQMHPAPEPVAGRPPGGRRDIGLRAHPTAPQHGNVVCIDRVVVGLAPMDGLHGEGMTEHAGNPLLGTEISQPSPRCTDIRHRRRHPRERAPWC